MVEFQKGNTERKTIYLIDIEVSDSWKDSIFFNFKTNKMKTLISKYRDWDILDEIPNGWSIDNTAGSPAPNTVFITNGKSVLSGQQKRCLLRVKAKQDINISKNDIVKNYIVEKKIENKEPYIFPAKNVNDLARLKFKEQILKEIMFDFMVCEIENWDKKEYINELQKMLNEINKHHDRTNIINGKQNALHRLGETF